MRIFTSVLKKHSYKNLAERKDVSVELAGSPCRIRTQKPGVHFAINFGGPAYENEGGVVFDDGRSAIASICSDSGEKIDCVIT